MVICDYFVLLKNTPERGLERLRESKFNSQHYVRQLTAACVSSPEDLVPSSGFLKVVVCMAFLTQRYTHPHK